MESWRLTSYLPNFKKFLSYLSKVYLNQQICLLELQYMTSFMWKKREINETWKIAKNQYCVQVQKINIGPVV